MFLIPISIPISKSIQIPISNFTTFLEIKRETEKARETAQEKKTNRLRDKQKDSYWHKVQGLKSEWSCISAQKVVKKKNNT